MNKNDYKRMIKIPFFLPDGKFESDSDSDSESEASLLVIVSSNISSLLSKSVPGILLSFSNMLT